MARKQGIEWERIPLGWRPDKTIAAEIGCRQQTVWHARTSRGIPAYQERVRMILLAVAGNRAGALLAKDAKKLLKAWPARGGLDA
jgi:hypothetical protein